jgi:hypothetical protein
MGLVVDAHRFRSGVLAEGGDIRGAIKKLGHLLFEGVGAGDEIESGLGGLDSR